MGEAKSRRRRRLRRRSWGRLIRTAYSPARSCCPQRIRTLFGCSERAQLFYMDCDVVLN